MKPAMNVPRSPRAPLVAALSLLSLGASCDRVVEPGPPQNEPAQASSAASGAQAARGDWTGLSPSGGAAAGHERARARSATTVGEGPCIAPLREPPPPAAEPTRNCPTDPSGAPVMPTGSVAFVDAEGAPTIPVEHARTPEHREHGLMYRTDMPKDAGMLFSWQDSEQRTFWMHNTCLPLDMLFIGRDGTIAGILEQVPPMNDKGRTVPCPATHVLEVHAGWTRKHGVRPGQKVRIDAPR